MSDTNNPSPTSNSDFEFVLNAFLVAYRPVLERELELRQVRRSAGADGAGASAHRRGRDQVGANCVRTVLYT